MYAEESSRLITELGWLLGLPLLVIAIRLHEWQRRYRRLAHR